MDRVSFVALACVAVVFPAFAIASIFAAAGNHISQGVALAGVATIGVASLVGPPRTRARR